MAVSGSCPKMIKYILFILAGLSLPLGIAMIIVFTLTSNVGILTKFDVVFQQTLSIQITLWILVGLGAALLIESMVLFLGTLYESKVSFQIVFLLCVIGIVGQISVGGYLSVQYNNVLPTIDQLASSVVKGYPNNSAQVLAVDSLQQNFSCCGWFNETDWLNSLWFQSLTPSSQLIYRTPGSCCIQSANIFYQTCQAKKNYFHTPCVVLISNYIYNQIQIISGLTVTEFFLMVTSLTLTGYFYSNMGRVEYKYS